MSEHTFILVGDNGHCSPLGDSGEVGGRLASLLHFRQTQFNPKTGRVDDNMFALSKRAVERHVDSVHGTLTGHPEVKRNDSFVPTLGSFNVKDLTHKMTRVMEQRLPPLSSERVFPINTEVHPGAPNYEQTRTYATGEAVVYRGGTGADIPEVGIGQASYTQKVVTFVSRFTINWLEQLIAGSFAGLDVQARKMMAARRVIAELENRTTFSGSEALGFKGLLNHPYMDTAISQVSYIDSSDADDIVSDLGDWANYADNESGSTFIPNTLLIAPKLANYLRNRRYGDNADKSILDWFLSANPHITKVELVRELNDAGGSGVHAMSFCRIGAGPSDSSLEIVKPMSTTLLPPNVGSLATEMFLVSRYGGLNQTEAGDNLVVFVTGNA